MISSIQGRARGESPPCCAGVAAELGGGGEQAPAEAFPPSCGVIGEGEHLHSDGEFACQAGDFAPDPVGVEVVQGRLVSPVSLAVRMRSSQWARQRWRNSRLSSRPRRVLAANAVSRVRHDR